MSDSGRGSWKAGCSGRFSCPGGGPSGFPLHLPGMISSEPCRTWGDGPGLFTPTAQMGKETPRAEGQRVHCCCKAGVRQRACLSQQPVFPYPGYIFSWGCCSGQTVGNPVGRGRSWKSVPLGFYADISRLLVLCLSRLLQVYPTASRSLLFPWRASWQAETGQTSSNAERCFREAGFWGW